MINGTTLPPSSNQTVIWSLTGRLLRDIFALVYHLLVDCLGSLLYTLVSTPTAFAITSLVLLFTVSITYNYYTLWKTDRYFRECSNYFQKSFAYIFTAVGYFIVGVANFLAFAVRAFGRAVGLADATQVETVENFPVSVDPKPEYPPQGTQAQPNVAGHSGQKASVPVATTPQPRPMFNPLAFISTRLTRRINMPLPPVTQASPNGAVTSGGPASGSNDGKAKRAFVPDKALSDTLDNLQNNAEMKCAVWEFIHLFESGEDHSDYQEMIQANQIWYDFVKNISNKDDCLDFVKRSLRTKKSKTQA